ncbi:hypothetical protein [Haloplanus salilacus]|uniref:hypothetical protein n=1 Tax=Haloplanus salilacus TaxID=2949994 RepID=UPI0030CF869B
MPECPYCTESCQDEQRLRSHLYHEHPREELGRIDERRVKHSYETFIQDDITTLEEYLEKEPTRQTTVEAVETFERVLRKTLEWEDIETVHNRIVAAETLLLDTLDTAVQTLGREFLLDIIETYDPRAERTPPPGVGATIGNIVGRDIIRTRLDEGVEAIPAAELAYLETLAKYEHPVESAADRRFKDNRWAVSYAYGWGIGHPTHDVAGDIHTMARDASTADWSEQTLIQAFYADPGAATDILEGLLADNQMHQRRFFLHSLKEVTRGIGIHTPQWDWNAEIEREFELEDDLVKRLRTVVADSEFSNEVSEDWPYTPI